MPTLCMMVGSPASGKSAVAAMLNQALPHSIIVGADTIRESHPAWSNPEIFSDVRRQIHLGLDRGRDVILDATNTGLNHRPQYLTLSRRYQASTVAVVMDTPLAMCLERHAQRQLNYGQFGLRPDIIARYCLELEQFLPSVREGFDRVVILTPNTPNPIDTILRLPA